MADGKKISQLPVADPLDGSELLVLVQGGATKQSNARSVTAYSRLGYLILCADWDLSSGVVPTTGGTGEAGEIERGNQFYISVGGAVSLPDGGHALTGMIFQARVNNPGTDITDTSKWLVSQTIT